MGEAYSEIGMKGEVSPTFLPGESLGWKILPCCSLTVHVAALHKKSLCSTAPTGTAESSYLLLPVVTGVLVQQ